MALLTKASQSAVVPNTEQMGLQQPTTTWTTVTTRASFSCKI